MSLTGHFKQNSKNRLRRRLSTCQWIISHHSLHWCRRRSFEGEGESFGQETMDRTLGRAMWQAPKRSNAGLRWNSG